MITNKITASLLDVIMYFVYIYTVYVNLHTHVFTRMEYMIIIYGSDVHREGKGTTLRT
jgi:hypothetical protein